MIFNVGITGTGSLIGQGIIKSIKNSKYADNYKLIGFDYFENTVGSFWCENNYILPDILKNEVTNQDWLDALISIIKIEKLDILFIGVDFELPILAKEKKTIKDLTGCHVIVSDKSVIDIGNDKYLTYEFLKKNELSYPETFLLEDIDIKTLTYPLIIKPRVGARSIGVYKVYSEADLKDKIKKVENPIIQELIGNDDTEYTCGVIFFENELKAQIPLRRTLKEGNTAVSEYSDYFSDKINQYVEQIAKKLKPFGSCNLQLRLDDNGIPKLFEINPRHSGTTYMRTLFGHNEVIYTLKYLLEGIEIDFELKEGKALRFFEEKLL
jgi:carbamoyl-phosphate synthase large subunit